jgi:hypothetical protein
MTKPSEFIEWLARPEHDNLQADGLAWLAYLKGRDDRPVATVESGTGGIPLCGTCNSFHVHDSQLSLRYKFCGNCGAPLDWSKADD